MKKFILLSFVTISIIFKSYSCSPLPYGGLCYDADQFNLIIKGTILDLNTDFAKILITKIYKGNESRDTVFIYGKDTTILQDTFNSCEDSVYFGVDKIGNVNDEIIIALNLGDSLLYNWEKNTEYQVRNNGLGQDYLFSIQNDTINGVIKWLEPEVNFPGYTLNKMHINAFDSLWNEGEMNCDELTSINSKFEIEKMNIYPNPFNETLTINNISLKSKSIKMYNLMGKEIEFELLTHINEVIINTSQLQKGVYILDIEEVGRKKIVKD